MIYEAINLSLWRALSSVRGESFLDVGCGTAALGARLEQNGNRVVGLTHSEAEARVARLRISDVRVVDLNAIAGAASATMSFSRLFDRIVFGDVLEHLVDPVNVLRGLLNLLAPNGSIYVSLPNVACFYVRFGLLMGRFDPSENGGVLDETHLHHYTFDSARAMLRKANLDVLDIDWVPAPSAWAYQRFAAGRAAGGPVRPASTLGVHQLYERLVFPIERRFVGVRPTLLANQFLFTCRPAPTSTVTG